VGKWLMVLALVAGCSAAQLDAAAKKAEQTGTAAKEAQAVVMGPVGQVVAAAYPPAGPAITGVGEALGGVAVLAAAVAAYFRGKAAEHRKAAAVAKRERNAAFDRLDTPQRKSAIVEALLQGSDNLRPG
jgi:hypothetical protein